MVTPVRHQKCFTFEAQTQRSKHGHFFLPSSILSTVTVQRIDTYMLFNLNCCYGTDVVAGGPPLNDCILNFQR